MDQARYHNSRTKRARDFESSGLKKDISSRKCKKTQCKMNVWLWGGCVVKQSTDRRLPQLPAEPQRGSALIVLTEFNPKQTEYPAASFPSQYVDQTTSRFHSVFHSDRTTVHHSWCQKNCSHWLLLVLQSSPAPAAVSGHLFIQKAGVCPSPPVCWSELYKKNISWKNKWATVSVSVFRSRL